MTVDSTTSHFHVLDRVLVTDAQELSGQVGVVTQVRRYSDGAIRHRYSVNLGGEGVILDHANLQPTNQREPIDAYLPPANLYPWDEVEIRDGDNVRNGIVDGWYFQDQILKYLVWFPEAGESEVCGTENLVRTGRSKKRRSGPTTSMRVAESGQELGSDQYEILEDIMDIVADARRE